MHTAGEGNALICANIIDKKKKTSRKYVVLEYYTQDQETTPVYSTDIILGHSL